MKKSMLSVLLCALCFMFFGSSVLAMENGVYAVIPFTHTLDWGSHGNRDTSIVPGVGVGYKWDSWYLQSYYSSFGSLSYYDTVPLVSITNTKKTQSGFSTEIIDVVLSIISMKSNSFLSFCPAILLSPLISLRTFNARVNVHTNRLNF